MKLILPLLFVVTNLAQAEAVLRLGEVSDKRTTGQFFAGLEIKLLVSGAEVVAAKGMRVKVESATDDTGKKLGKSKNHMGSDDNFKPLEEPFGQGPKRAGEFETSVDLENPPRSAKSVELVGKVELMSPNADPTSIVTANVAKDAGKALADPALKAAGVEITLKAPKDDEFTYELKDPGGKIASVEFCAADGKPLKTSGSSSMGFQKSKSVSVTVNNAPADVIAKIYLLTAKSVVTVPFKLSIPLP